MQNVSDDAASTNIRTLKHCSPLEDPAVGWEVPPSADGADVDPVAVPAGVGAVVVLDPAGAEVDIEAVGADVPVGAPGLGAVGVVTGSGFDAGFAAGVTGLR